ncbi:MAG: ATP-binding cassette domain-containing protein [Actinomycetota bacterium]|nr:ATP-binding cassette domain-containing protein [Actinomycetota bacterium]
MATVTFRQASRTYPGGSAPAVDRLDLEIDDGELVTLVGPSGSGKSTALRMLAGLEPIDSGEVLVGDEIVTGRAPKDRDLAMVFQSYALYPHMNVANNIGFPLRMRGVPRAGRLAKVKEVAEVLGLADYLTRRPRQLSGGQRQRVAMGRAIIREPHAFLMDEPLSNLDAQLRTQTRASLAELQARLGITTIYVTHDQVEAMTLGHRLAVLKDGQLQQYGTPRDLYDRPRNTFVAGFLGSPAMNLLPATLSPEGLNLAGAALPLEGRVSTALADRTSVVMGLRPEHIDISSYPPAAPCVPARVRLTEDQGSMAFVHVSLLDSARPAGGGLPLIVSGDSMALPAVGQDVWLCPRMNCLHLFDVVSGSRIDLRS